MKSELNPYLSFRDSAKPAMEFYQSIFGGELSTNTFAEFDAAEDPADRDKIMHSVLRTPSGMVLMAADVPSSMPLGDNSSFTLSLNGDNESELSGYWERLIEGGSITEPLEVAPWGDSFGMCTDRFGE
ncbi:VOC family protein [Arthrobacter sp. zg-Y1219]|uniref:VOC family protein n=1 Tax=Arthrobacter sp. zg-Y1219 TaxID=3049067 RepID=UPI0024C46076|nr:VOC family protein [Arthrobacter sp. zg-Y1219]MDK1361720.1 VOC family protein [Arthrobacter sp. zg-Y1219]